MSCHKVQTSTRSLQACFLLPCKPFEYSFYGLFTHPPWPISSNQFVIALWWCLIEYSMNECSIFLTKEAWSMGNSIAALNQLTQGTKKPFCQTHHDVVLFVCGAFVCIFPWMPVNWCVIVVLRCHYFSTFSTSYSHFWRERFFERKLLKTFL